MKKQGEMKEEERERVTEEGRRERMNEKKQRIKEERDGKFRA